jgi:L-iditol 2-dehydrogenase
MDKKTMRAVMFLGPGRLETREVPIPEIKDDEILVKIRAATTCGTDLKTYNRGYHLLKPPCRFGHEFAGDVAAVGRNVDQFKPGMRVVAHNSAPCHVCFYCKNDQQNLCENPVFNFGSYAEYITVPAPIVRLNTYEIPDHISYPQMSIMEPFATVVHGQRIIHIRPGEHVAIIGTGPIGLLHLQMALKSGASGVIAVDLSEKRLSFAKQLGATVTVNSADQNPVEAIKELTSGRGVDVSIESAGKQGAWLTAAQVVRKGGRVLWFGGMQKDVTIELDAYSIHYGELTLHGVFHATPLDVLRAYELITSGVIDTRVLISGELPLEKVEEGLKMMEKGEAVKMVIRPDVS